MKTHASILLALSLGLMVSTATAKPQDERPDPQERFNQTDTNQDGFLSLDEIKAAHDGRMAEKFSEMDTDGDGLLSKEELKASRESMREKFADKREKPAGEQERPDPHKMFQRMDANESGSLSKDEVKGRLAKAFDDIDSNGDGELTPEELKAFHESKRNERGPKE